VPPVSQRREVIGVVFGRYEVAEALSSAIETHDEGQFTATLPDENAAFTEFDVIVDGRTFVVTVREA
jgi:hypothetical protein